MKNTTLILLLLCLCASKVLAQLDSDEHQHYVGGYIGGSYQLNGITNLVETIITRDHDKSTYKTDPLSGAWLTAGLAYYFKSSQLTWLGFQTKVNYTRYSGGYDYETLPPYDPHEYTMKFKYDYLSLGLSAKFNIWRGLTIGVGGIGGINLTPDRIDYTHTPDRTVYGNQEAIQSELRRYVHGRATWGPVFGLGWEFPSGFSIEGQLVYLASDLVYADPENPYSFSTAPKNNITAYQLTVGYFFPMN